MPSIIRNIHEPVTSDLSTKMVFISGPRQVGKTTLARQILESSPGVYMNWDNIDDKKRILSGKWPEKGIVVLDEIHKYRQWKNYIKGQYDTRRDSINFLITGSARLNIYKKGGDSLQGRYHHYRLHPFTIGEIENVPELPVPFQEIPLGVAAPDELLQQMLNFSGFPEPFISADERTKRRWRKERLEQIIREDVRDVSNLHDISLIELFTAMIAPRIGSPFSLNSIREDLNVSYRTAANWLSILRQLYVCYTVPPFQGKLQQAFKKEPKVYLWDWSEPEDPGARFENVVSGHLLKLCHALEDREGYATELRYIRDRQKREVDFLVTCDKKPWFAVETKTTEPKKTNLGYFRERLQIPFTYCVCRELKETYVKDGTFYVPAGRFLRALGA